MALTTDVIPESISVALGRPAPSLLEQAQWDMWIADALRFIQRRVTVLEVDEESVDPDVLGYVIREAVVAQVRKPDDWTRGAEDSTNSGKWFRKGAGRVTILDEWWDLLGMSTSTGKAFSVDLMPPGAGIDGDRETYWWV